VDPGLDFEGQGAECTEGNGSGRSCPPQQPNRGSGERRKFPQQGPERSPSRKRILMQFELEKKTHLMLEI